MPSIALVASSGVPIVTNAKPRERPVSRSETRWTSLTVPNSWNAARTPSALVLNEGFPTYRRVFIACSIWPRDKIQPAPEGAIVLEAGFRTDRLFPTEHRSETEPTSRGRGDCYSLRSGIA